MRRVIRLIIRFNFESEQYAWLSPSSLTYNLIEDGLSISGSLCTPVPSLRRRKGDRVFVGEGVTVHRLVSDG